MERILVDGEEFFSDDPTMATRNLRADAVSKVQVFDKRSDQSELSGIPDGSTTKTLNLELKASSKKGYFGKVSAGGLEKYYDGQAFINGFKGKKKIIRLWDCHQYTGNRVKFRRRGKIWF